MMENLRKYWKIYLQTVITLIVIMIVGGYLLVITVNHANQLNIIAQDERDAKIAELLKIETAKIAAQLKKETAEIQKQIEDVKNEK